MKYRGTYVIERQLEDGQWEVLFSASDELNGPSVAEAHDPLLTMVSEKINRLTPMLTTAEEDPDQAPPVEVVPNAPTIRAVNNEKE